VYDIIIEKNTEPTMEDILSFTEREFVHAHADVKYKVENTRFENGKHPFCGVQFLDKNYYLDDYKNLEMSGTNKQLDMKDMRHLNGVVVKNADGLAPNPKDKAAVKKAFSKFTERFYKEINSGVYQADRCDVEPCSICDDNGGLSI